MEEKGSSSSFSSTSNSRWNPTTEQIAILEALYNQGIRTPSSEQIQQITIKLREFGMTEGKNVFYWFQNHKARQRQKMKQERFAYYSRLLNHGVPMPVMAHVPHPRNAPALHHPQGCSNVARGPNYFGMHQHQHPSMFVPRTVPINPVHDQYQRVELREYSNTDEQRNYSTAYNKNNNNNDDGMMIDVMNKVETLELFPLHPTGILESAENHYGSSLTCDSIDLSDHTPEEDSDRAVGGVDDGNSPHLFNFFG